ncbi:MAG: hypothetical protein WAM66_14370 [Acidobacteriaceae bacterium]
MMIPGTDPMFHRHLVAAYAVVWIVQVSYLAYVVWKWTKARKAQQSTGKNPR